MQVAGRYQDGLALPDVACFMSVDALRIAHRAQHSRSELNPVLMTASMQQAAGVPFF